jgi:hypothetical protein
LIVTDPVHLLEGAIPPIPAPLQAPPQARIRARVRRRRFAIGGVVTLAVVAMVTPLAFIAAGSLHSGPSTMVGGATVTPDTPTPSAGALTDAVPWRAARVSRDGITLTLFVNPPSSGCETYPSPTAHVNEQLDAVVITVTGTAEPADCSRIIATKLKVTLNDPLAGRVLKDGRDGVTARAYLDAVLPVVPAPWFETTEDYLSVDQSGWSLGFTRPGGPDLMFWINVGHVSGTPTVRLGSRKGEFYATGQSNHGVRWQVGDLVYSMLLLSSEGTTSSQSDLEQVVSQLTWP